MSLEGHGTCTIARKWQAQAPPTCANLPIQNRQLERWCDLCMKGNCLRKSALLHPGASSALRKHLFFPFGKRLAVSSSRPLVHSRPRINYLTSPNWREKQWLFLLQPGMTYSHATLPLLLTSDKKRDVNSGSQLLPFPSLPF